MPRPLFLLAAVALSAALFAISWVPIEFPAAYGDWHWIAHFGVFALLALLWRRALLRARVLAVAAGVAAFGFAQEAIEIVGHAHGFELADALVDAAGAAVGIAAAHVLFKQRS